VIHHLSTDHLADLLALLPVCLVFPLVARLRHLHGSVDHAVWLLLLDLLIIRTGRVRLVFLRLRLAGSHGARPFLFLADCLGDRHFFLFIDRKLSHRLVKERRHVLLLWNRLNGLSLADLELKVSCGRGFGKLDCGQQVLIITDSNHITSLVLIGDLYGGRIGLGFLVF